MLHRAEPAQVQIPVVAGLVQAQLVHAGGQLAVVLFALAAADQLADAGHQHIGGGHRPAVGVLLHVEALDLLGVVGDKDGLLEHHLGQVALVLGLDVHPPLHRVLELFVVLFQDLDGVGVADPAELAAGHQLQPLDQPLVDELVEEVHLVGAVVQHIADDVLGHGLGHVHIAGQVAEGHLRLDHPELGGVPGGKALLRPEGGPKGVHLAKGHGHGLGLQLARDGQVDRLAEEILAVVGATVLSFGQVVQVQGGDPEHLARALAVGGGQDGRMGVDEAVLLEEAVDGVGRHAAHPERRVEGVGAGAQGGHGAQVLHAHLLLLQGVVLRGAGAQDLDAVGVQLKGLLGLGGQDQAAGHPHAGVQAGVGHLLVVGELGRLKDHLQGLEAAAVRQGDEADVLAVADVLGPAADGQLGPVGRGGAVEGCDLGAFHNVLPPFKCTRFGLPGRAARAPGRSVQRRALPPRRRDVALLWHEKRQLLPLLQGEQAVL